MEIHGTRLNCTTIFLLPGIGLYRKDLLEYGFLSAYLDDVNHSIHYDRSLYLLFLPEDRDVFQDWLRSQYRNNRLLVEDYDYPGGYVVLVYSFPKQYKNEFALFLEGKYSLFRTEYIKLFPEDVEVTDEKGDRVIRKSLHYHIYTRSTTIKKYWEDKIGESLPAEAELWGIPDLSKEVLDINNL